MIEINKNEVAVCQTFHILNCSKFGNDFSIIFASIKLKKFLTFLFQIAYILASPLNGLKAMIV